MHILRWLRSSAKVVKFNAPSTYFINYSRNEDGVEKRKGRFLSSKAI